MNIAECQSALVGEYAQLIYESPLGRKYYPCLEFVASALEKGLTDDELYEGRQADGNLLGLLWFNRRGAFHQFPYLHYLLVQEQHLHRGLGTTLLTYYHKSILMAEGKAVLRTKSFLVVDAQNSPARAFYEKHGYALVTQIDGLFRKGVDEQLMMRTVAAG
jgi:ribosomal protein S18 acetylase RimI-like enzyme